MASSKDSPSPKRAILWCVPRCLSTSFMRAISNVDDFQVWCEPYLMVQVARVTSLPDNFTSVNPETIPKHFYSMCSDYNKYEWVKKQLEGEFPGKRLVFVKEMVKGILGQYEFIPKGYRHTFLIRHPLKVFYSLKKMFQIQNWPLRGDIDLDKAPEKNIPAGFYFKEMVELYDHIKKFYESQPIILDADDLQANPAGVMKAYCKELGVPFDERIINWDGDVSFDNWMAPKEMVHVLTAGVHKISCSGGSAGFTPLTDLPSKSQLPEDAVRVADASMKYYQILHDQRLVF